MIVNPQPGDNGLALFSMRDVSVLKSSRNGPVQPGSRRYMSAADGFYLGGFLNPTAERYVMIDDEGVTIEGVAKTDDARGKFSLDCGKRPHDQRRRAH